MSPRSRHGRWVDVTVGDKTVGYVYQQDGKWVAVMEADDKTGTQVGTADRVREAVQMVTAAYLRT
jgi:hypothetical protein